MKKIVIIGAGFTGTTLAVQLANKGFSNIVLIEKSEKHFFAGPAYKDQSLNHLLNVRASEMGAFEQRPNEFYEWLITNLPNKYLANDFVPRKFYGDYLKSLISPYIGNKIKIVNDEIIDIDENCVIGLMFQIKYSKVYLCVGGNYLEITRNAKDEDTIKIKGSGLSVVDLIVDRVKSGYCGKFELYSRRGLLPMVHDGSKDIYNYEPKLLDNFIKIKKLVKENSENQFIINSIRSEIKNHWLSLTEKERSQFNRYLKPYWEVLRHRMTPEQNEIVQALIKANKLFVNKMNGSLIKFDYDCTGFQKFNSPLIQNLKNRKMIVFDKYETGFISICNNLVTIGPMEKPFKLEITAVREIRKEISGLLSSLEYSD